MASATRSSRASSAFTLVEVLISLTLASVLLAAVMGSNIALLKTQVLTGAYAEMDAEARTALELMADDVRQMKSITIEADGFSGQVPARSGGGTTTLRWQYQAYLGTLTRSLGNATTTQWTRIASCQFVYHGAGTMDTSLSPPRMNRGEALTAGTSTKVKQIRVNVTTLATVLRTQATQQSLSADITARP